MLIESFAGSGRIRGGGPSTSLTPRNIIIVGNSTSSTGLGNWPAVFATNHPQSTVTNVSFGGSSTNDYVGANFAGAITSNLSSTLPNEVIFFEGANWLDFNFDDGHGHSFGNGYTNGAQAYALTTTFCSQARSAAYPIRIYMCTLDHWRDTDYDLPSFYTAIDQYNTALKAATSDWDRLIDFGGRSGFDPENDTVNGYYIDGIHKTSAGIAKMGQLFSQYYDEVNY